MEASRLRVDSLPLRCAPAGNDKEEPHPVIPGAQSAGRGSMIKQHGSGFTSLRCASFRERHAYVLRTAPQGLKLIPKACSMAALPSRSTR